MIWRGVTTSEKLIQRLALNLDGILPAFIPKNRVAEFPACHAYHLTLRADRLTELSAIAERLAAELPV